MVQTIPKAKIHWVERWAGIAGLVLSLLGVGAVASHMVGQAGTVAAAALAAGTVAALAGTLVPGLRLTYRMEADRLVAGRMELPFADMVSLRQVELTGALLYGGPALVGYLSGRAWAPRLGKFWLEASTGIGPAVLITMRGGQRIVITPENPSVTMQLLDSLRLTVLPPEDCGIVVPFGRRRPHP